MSGQEGRRQFAWRDRWSKGLPCGLRQGHRAHLPSPSTPSLGWGRGGAARTEPAASSSPQTPQCKVKSTWVSPNHPLLSPQAGAPQGEPGALGPQHRACVCPSCLSLPMQGQAEYLSHTGSLARTSPCPMLPPGPEDPGTCLIRNPCWPGCPPALERGFPLLSLHCSPPWPWASPKAWLSRCSQPVRERGPQARLWEPWPHPRSLGIRVSSQPSWPGRELGAQ